VDWSIRSGVLLEILRWIVLRARADAISITRLSLPTRPSWKRCLPDGSLHGRGIPPTRHTSGGFSSVTLTMWTPFDCSMDLPRIPALRVRD
jgi:hypothetical protein